MAADEKRSWRDYFREIRRRHVLRVALVYVIVGWVVLQVASILVPQLLLPSWVTRLIVLLVVLGFPIALVIAWAFEITPEGVRRTPRQAGGADAGGDGAPGGTMPKWPWAGAGLVLLAAGVFLVPRWLHRSAAREARASVPRIEQLADSGRYARAYRLASRVGEDLPGDTILARLWPRIANRLTVKTDPEGARVEARSLPEAEDASPSRPAADSSRSGGAAASPDSVPAGFTLLGTTPIDSLRVPREPELLRIEKSGYAPVERLASAELSRAQGTVGPSSGRDIDLAVPLVPADSAPEDMVFVPGGEYRTVTPDLPLHMKAHLDDYFIDRFEVSNARFREFVTGGGYRDRSLWPAPIVSHGDTLTFQQAVGKLVDRTGLPGPRGWTSQEFPEGRGDYPVTGVTWYEASAYCAFRNKSLPTVFQWEKAARNGRTAITGVVMPWGYTSPQHDYHDRANFAGSGTVPVDAHPFGISPFGAYAMAGNVKEWTANPIGDGRTATGGSWQDPMYTFSEFGAYDPFYSSDALGFRCARVRATDARASRDQGSVPIDVNDRTPVYHPVDEKTYRTLLSQYRYDRIPLEPQVVDSVETPDWTRLKVSYAGPGQERVLAYLWLPKSTAPPYQTIVAVPGIDVFYGVPPARDAERWNAPLVRGGRALFTVVMKGMTGRPWGPDHTYPKPSSVRFRDEMVLRDTELRLGLDYLDSRDDIDTGRLAYLGTSWGAASHLIFAAVDPRYKAVVFVGGGIDERLKPNLPAADNVNFAPYIDQPKLLVNGRHDEEHPWFTRGLPLWNLLRQPKKLVLVPDGGHIPPASERIPAINRFLDDVLGPVGDARSSP